MWEKIHWWSIILESRLNLLQIIKQVSHYWMTIDVLNCIGWQLIAFRLHFRSFQHWMSILGIAFCFYLWKKSSIDRSKLGGHGLSESVTDSMSTKNLCYRYVPFVDSGFATKLSIVKFVLVIFRFFGIWSSWSEKIEKGMKRSNWEEAPQTFFIDFETTINNPQLYFDYINIKSNKYFVLPTSYPIQSGCRGHGHGQLDVDIGSANEFWSDTCRENSALEQYSYLSMYWLKMTHLTLKVKNQYSDLVKIFVCKILIYQGRKHHVFELKNFFWPASIFSSHGMVFKYTFWIRDTVVYI